MTSKYLSYYTLIYREELKNKLKQSQISYGQYMKLCREKLEDIYNNYNQEIDFDEYTNLKYNIPSILPFIVQQSDLEKYTENSTRYENMWMNDYY